MAFREMAFRLPLQIAEKASAAARHDHCVGAQTLMHFLMPCAQHSSKLRQLHAAAF